MNKKSHSPKRFAIVGLGGRCRMFIDAIIGKYSDQNVLVGFCDVNSARMRAHRDRILEKSKCQPPALYAAKDFETMLRETKADTVIVTSIDRTHHDYIIRAMNAGCDVITEKPLTTDIEKCRAILDAVERTGRNLKVTFNYRYAPSHSKVKKLLMEGAIGQVTSVHFEWLLSTKHGADYFRRWHRDKRNSGGLMVHKSTHHFDLVNWWLDSSPELVFGLGKLAFYGRANLEARGEVSPYYRATGSDFAKDDPFALHLDNGGDLQKFYLEAEGEDGYLRDQNVFGDGISIEDTMSVLVRYRNKAHLTYSLTAYAPWEGFRVSFNGVGGRIELEQIEKPYVNAGGDSSEEGATAKRTMRLCRNWQKPELVPLDQSVGGHGGADPIMLEDIFNPDSGSDTLKFAAGPIDGARSILTGIAANRSFETGSPVYVDDLLKI